MSDMTIIPVHELPACDFCGEPAEYDDKTTWGPWANMCAKCQKTKGFGIGSKRELIEKNKAVKTIKDFKTFPPVVGVPLSLDSVVTVKCSWCKQKRRVETDANYLVTCEGCGNPYRLRSAI